MLSASGDFYIGEAQAAGRLLARRLAGFPWLSLAGVIAGVLVVGPALTWISERLGQPLIEAASILLIPLVALGSWLLLMRAYRRRMRRGWEMRGMTNPSPATFRIEDAGLVIETPLSETRCFWPGISEITATKKHWVFVANGLAYTLPKRFFSDPAFERTFLREALSRMPASARTRSRKTMIYVGETV